MEILTEAQYNRFHADGYLKFTRVLSDEQVAKMRSALDRVIAQEFAREDDDGLPPEFRYGHDRRGEDRAASGRAERAIHQFVNMWKVVPEYREAIHNPKVTAVIRDLMGVPRVRLWHDQV